MTYTQVKGDQHDSACSLELCCNVMQQRVQSRPYWMTTQVPKTIVMLGLNTSIANMTAEGGIQEMP